MMKALNALLLVTSLLAGAYASAQGTYSNGIRSGYVGPTSGTQSSTTNGTSGSPTTSYSSPATRNPGTGQGRTEGAMGLTPQLQRELGISRQQ
jgi:hypothetical protein